MSVIEDMANKCLQAQGYMVIRSNHSLSRGRIVKGIRGRNGSDLGHDVVVLRETDYADYCRTAEIAGAGTPPLEPNHYYYRVTAE